MRVFNQTNYALQNTTEQIEKQLLANISDLFLNYGTVIGCLVIGIVIGWLLKRYLTDQKYHKEVAKRMNDKDLRIAELNFLVHEELNRINIPKVDEPYINRLKRFFKNSFKIK